MVKARWQPKMLKPFKTGPVFRRLILWNRASGDWIIWIPDFNLISIQMVPVFRSPLLFKMLLEIWCLIHKAHLHFWCKFWVFSFMNYIKLLMAMLYMYVLLLSAKLELQWQISNKNFSQKLSLSLLFFRYEILQKLKIFPKWAFCSPQVKVLALLLVLFNDLDLSFFSWPMFGLTTSDCSDWFEMCLNFSCVLILYLLLKP
jgi:hypothetical protein